MRNNRVLNKISKWINNNKKLAILIGMTIIMTVFVITLMKQPIPKQISYTDFGKMVNAHNVSSVTIDLNASTFMVTDKNNNLYVTDNPKSVDFKKYLLENNINVKEINTKDGSITADIISYALKTVLLLFALKFGYDLIMKNNNSLASVSEEAETIPNINFSCIAGNIEAKEEMQYLVHFLKNPKQYLAMGAKLPKGVIFYGPPGTGKTLTAKAIAGEAEVPFFHMSGSDFVELYVGLGAKKVRELFKKAKSKAPCIIFIDEIDSVGGHRGRDSHSERDQTINALLSEMDGFNGSEGVIVIAATNRIENLDTALIRPGRFDKHIPINLPDAKDRLEILNTYAKNKKFSPDVNLDELSKLTIGFSGAGLETLLNEATILAVTRKKVCVTKEDIDDAYFKVIMGGDKKRNRQDRKEDEIRLVAWHESGHALASKLLSDNEVPKVTIIPSTSGAGGVTFITPKKMGLMSKRELLNDVKIRYAGRVAEYLLLGNQDDVTTGASNDIKQATQQLRSMIVDYGMNDTYGMISFDELNVDNKIILEQVSQLGKQLYQEICELLSKPENKIKLEKIANALIEKETLCEAELDELISKNSI